METSKNTRVRLISDADSAYTLTVIKTEGKRGINVRASYKSKGTAKAQAGCRSVHQTHEEADKAVKALVETATTQRGWKVQMSEQKKSSVGAFTELPAAPVKGKK
jgi:hypothetical protein